MKFKIEFTAHLYLKGIQNNSWVEIDSPISVSQFLTNYKINDHQQKFIIPTINKKQENLSYVLQDNDELFLYLPVGGG